MANLLVTYEPAHQGKAEDEVRAVLKPLGEEPRFEESPMQGVFLLNVSEPKKLVAELNRIFGSDPEQFRTTFRWVPVDKWTSADLGDIAEVMEEFDSQMDEGESWKLEVHKRSMKEPTTEIIRTLAERINKPKVDLRDPDVVVCVEIVGNRAACSLVKRGELLNTARK